MKNKIQKRFLLRKPLFLVSGILFIFGLALTLAIQPALARSPEGDVLLQATATVGPGTGTPTVTGTVGTATVVGTATTAGTPTVVGTATTVGTPTTVGTATAPAQVLTATATTTGTLAAPVVTGTPTQLVPVTGADLNESNPGGSGNIGAWVALWVLGLLLVAFGVKARLDRQK